MVFLLPYFDNNKEIITLANSCLRPLSFPTDPQGRVLYTTFHHCNPENKLYILFNLLNNRMSFLEALTKNKSHLIFTVRDSNAICMTVKLE